MSAPFAAPPPLPAAVSLDGAVDGHIHACAHLNARSLTAFEAVRQAAAAGMRAIGLMDNFASSVGVAALCNRELGALGVEVFGGLILEPQAGGLSARAVAAALRCGYGAPGDGARFVSLPTHATRHVAAQEGRRGAYLDACLSIPERGPLPDPLPEIFDLVAAADAVRETGHLSAPETLRVIEAARGRGVARILVPASLFSAAEAVALADAGAVLEFSYFFVSPATQVPLTHVDAEAHTIPATTLPAIAASIAAAGPARCILSSDCGVGVLPVPVEGLRSFAAGLAACGVAPAALSAMLRDNPARLFRIGEAGR